MRSRSSGPTAGQTTDSVVDRVQAAVAARVPGAAALGLVLPPGAHVVPATHLADPSWTADVLGERLRWQGSDERRVLATVWWYSASTVLLTPAVAGLITGRPVSGRLADTVVALLPGGHPVAAEALEPGADPAAELRQALVEVIACVAEAGRMRERPLWAVATDSLANQCLTLGRAVARMPQATGLAAQLAAAIGPPLPAPRYVDVGGARFTRRASCCLVLAVPGQSMCTSCPRRHPVERRALLEEAATWS